jgi:hypothetical protein
VHVVLVSHSHWDREWHKTFEAFRARLVDLIDRVLDLVEDDSGFRFLLDGQTIVVEDYLQLRPARRDALAAAVRAGRIAIGPWWVQPDSLLPSGEAHVRNLLEGRRVGAALGPVSAVAYCPDSFGHPAQFPQLFRGFGLGPFVYWRGNGDEIDRLPSEWTWEAPDGSTVGAHVLRQGYFSAAGLPADVDAAVAWAEGVARELSASSPSGIVLLMNGFDHALPEPHAGAVAAGLARRTGWTVVHGTLDDFAALVPRESPRFRGELLGARLANLLPGVWSARLPLKLRNRRCETQLCGWAEPWAALAGMLGAADERPALRTAWRALLQNQAHDSIGGCSQDRVHAQMLARYDTAGELAAETTTRALERIAGLGLERRSPWSEGFDVAVFNPSPHPRTDLVRIRPVPRTWIEWRGDSGREIALHPWIPMPLGTEGMTANGRPARLVADPGEDRIQVLPDVPALAVECVVADVPAYGWTRVRLASSAPHPDHEDDEREITVGDLRVRAADDGTLAVRAGGCEYAGLCALEDVGDRGDTYDVDPVPGNVTVGPPVVRRRLHATGVQELEIDRVLELPLALAADRTARDAATVPEVVRTTARLVPGTGRVDLDVRVENLAHDHRLRLLFPTGAPVATFHAATTFDVAVRSTASRAGSSRGRGHGRRNDRDHARPRGRLARPHGSDHATAAGGAGDGRPRRPVRRDDRGVAVAVRRGGRAAGRGRRAGAVGGTRRRCTPRAGGSAAALGRAARGDRQRAQAGGGWRRHRAQVAESDGPSADGAGDHRNSPRPLDAAPSRRDARGACGAHRRRRALPRAAAARVAVGASQRSAKNPSRRSSMTRSFAARAGEVGSG